MPARKKILLFSFVFIFAVVFLFLPKTIFAQNLLQNPGFEEGTERWNFAPSTATFSATPSVKRSGDYGGRITKEDSSSWAYFGQKLAIEAEKYYQFSGWVLLNDNAMKNVKLRFYWLDASEGKISNSPIEVESRDKNSSFQFLQTEAALSPSNAQFVEAQGYVYLDQKDPLNPAVFDDLSFEEVLPPPTSTPTSEPADNPTSTPTPTPTPTPGITKAPTPTKKQTPTPKETPGLVLGEGEEATEAFYPWEATPTGKTEESTPSSFPTKLVVKFLLVGGLISLFTGAIYLWYTQLR